METRTIELAAQIAGLAAGGAAAQQEDLGSAHKAKSARQPTSHTAAQPQQAHAHSARRSQRQQHQRQQLQQKQIEAEKAHAARLSVGQSRAVAVTTTNRLKPKRTVSRAKRSAQSTPVGQRVFSDENQQQVARQQNGAVDSQASSGKAAEGKSPIGRKGKSSPSAGVKKQTSPVGKGGSAGLGLGSRFPLRVRKNAQQHVKGPLDGKLAQASQNRGLGDLSAHMPSVHTQ